VHRVTNWISVDLATRGQGAHATNAPRYLTLVYRAFVICRVQMAEIDVYGQTMRLGSDIPPLLIDHMEMLQTRRKRYLYMQVHNKYFQAPYKLYQPKEHTAQAMAGEDFLRKA
jgi:hypothetical protein